MMEFHLCALSYFIPLLVKAVNSIHSIGNSIRSINHVLT